MEKSYYLVITLAFFLILAYKLEWALPIKLIVILNSATLLVNCFCKLFKIIRGAK